MNQNRTWLQLRFAASLALVSHLIAGLAMALVLRHGLETNPSFPERLGFLANHTALWVAAWLTWNVAALSILYFYFSFSRMYENQEQSNASLLRLAVLLSTAGIAADMAAEAIEMGVLPDLAILALKETSKELLIQPATQLFLTVHRVDVMLTGYLANGLYSISALLLAWQTRHSYHACVWMTGIGVGVFGLVLSASVLIQSIDGMFWSNVLLVPSIVIWLGGIAVTSHKRAREQIQ